MLVFLFLCYLIQRDNDAKQLRDECESPPSKKCSVCLVEKFVLKLITSAEEDMNAMLALS